MSFAKQKKFPGFLVLLFFVEMWERYSYYGIRALLVLYLVEKLGFDDQRAYFTYSLYASMAFAGPLLGGYIADKVMGFKKMVLAGGIVISLGHLVMAFASMNSEFIYMGLALIVVGTGLFKGNVTNLLGSCYEDTNSEKNRGFTLFYIGINLGALLSAISSGIVKNYFGWHAGFGIAGIGMLVGLIVFLFFYKMLDGKGEHKDNYQDFAFASISPMIWLIAISILVSFIVSITLKHAGYFAPYISRILISILAVSTIYIVYVTPREYRKKIFALIILVIFFLMFFAVESQLGSLFNLFASRHVVFEIFGIKLPTQLSQSINPFAIIVIGFLVSYCANFKGRYSLLKFITGLIAMGFCSLLIYLGCVNSSSDGLVSPLYLIFAISLMGFGEVLIAPFILSQATSLAHKKIKGFVMGTVMLAVSCSNFAGMLISEIMSIPKHANIWTSLDIYRAGFFKIAEFYALVTFAFVIAMIFFLNKVVLSEKVEK